MRNWLIAFICVLAMWFFVMCSLIYSFWFVPLAVFFLFLSVKASLAH